MGLFKKLTNREDVKLNINSDMENILTQNGDIIPTENNIYNSSCKVWNRINKWFSWFNTYLFI